MPALRLSDSVLKDTSQMSSSESYKNWLYLGLECCLWWEMVRRQIHLDRKNTFLHFLVLQELMTLYPHTQ